MANLDTIPLVDLRSVSEQDCKKDGYAALLVVALIAAYSVNLYKLLPDVASYFLYKPAAWSDVATLFGKFLAGGLLLLCLVQAREGMRHLRSVVVGPCILQLYLAVILTLALLLNYDQKSLLCFTQYVGGNLLLFFLGLLFCSSTRRIKLVLAVWVFAAIVHASISLWFTYQGHNVSSLRRALVPSIGIRTGYFCAVALLALFFSNKSIRVPALLGCVLLVGGVVTSGSRASLLLLFAVPLAIQFVYFPRGDLRVKPKSLAFMLFVLLTLALFLAVILSRSSAPGFIRDTIDWTSYQKASWSRIEHFRNWMNAASDHWTLGNGLAFPYDESERARTHSTSLALFCQAGASALLAYWLFVVSVLAAGFNAVKQIRLREESASNGNLLTVLLAIVLLLAAKAEITGTVSGNRELWFFCGVLLSAISCCAGPRKCSPPDSEASSNTAGNCGEAGVPEGA